MIGSMMAAQLVAVSSGWQQCEEAAVKCSMTTGLAVSVAKLAMTVATKEVDFLVGPCLLVQILA